MQVQLVATFPTKNLTLAIALKGKNNVLWQQVCLGHSSWSQGGRVGINDCLMAFLQIFSITKLSSQPEA